MDELTIGDKTFISSKKAAQITGYAKDYVGQLCRGGYVEAQMVGRNWYVLEKSIRDHRFGNETKKDLSTNEEGKTRGAEPYRETWNAPVYAQETIVSMPNLRVKVAEAVQNEVFFAESASDTLTDMQSAWKEWFAKKQDVITQPTLVTEEGDESDIVIEEGIESLEIDSDEEDFITPDSFEEEMEQETAVSFTQITREMEIQPEIEDQRTPIAPPAMHRTVSMADVIVPPAAPQPVQEGYVSEHYKLRKRKYASNGSKEGSSVVANAVLVACMLIAVGIAVLGSGFGDAYTDRDGAQYSAIHFFNGTSLYKVSK